MKLRAMPKEDRAVVHNHLGWVVMNAYRTTDALEKIRSNVADKFGDAPELENLLRASESLNQLIDGIIDMLEPGTFNNTGG